MLKSFKMNALHWVLSFFLFVSMSSHADPSYPNRSVRLVIPFATGGSNDIVGRFIADQLTKRLGEPFVVDNRGGAGGTMGTDLVNKSKPDGYTLLLISTPHTANASLYKKLPYHPLKDFAPIARIGTAPQVISVYPGLPVKTLPELIAYAKARPGQVNFVSSGVGSSQHLVTEMFASQADLQLVHVPYKGAGAALADVAAGHAQISVGTILQGLSLIKGDRLRPLAVSGNKRQAVLPDVPTASEVGLKGYDADNWWGILAPVGTPPEVIQKLSTTLADILSKPETIKKLAEESATVAYQGPEDFSKFMEAESQKWAQLIKKLKLQPE
ncbi:tripartite tricarboxylate transporter substrate binding protein [Polynucleobacter kasalickyi]|uniref:Tripartite-type tricarboxylate transporter, receptor component TctC n=1 Tax=Polynucleobacter kasalickyi TaxID=1938817 RepID=A0A1W1Y440_9BURK|nr:tripartite tricarboxylate transporter substrate binding protein [Polynucleobacter kasalickyi]SMC30970.1 Tripartite-type tricarboxylate transporter, receptor component TctC [Polynucleobacter kasalickyi]